jgi:hypothetical protein
VDLGITENFIISEVVVSTNLRTLKKRILYRLHLTDRQLAKDNRVV